MRWIPEILIGFKSAVESIESSGGLIAEKVSEFFTKKTANQSPATPASAQTTSVADTSPPGNKSTASRESGLNQGTANLIKSPREKCSPEQEKNPTKKGLAPMPKWQQDFQSLNISQVIKCVQKIDKYCDYNQVHSEDGERGSILARRTVIEKIQISTKLALEQFKEKMSTEGGKSSKKRKVSKNIKAIQEEFKGEIEKQLNKLQGIDRSSFSNHELSQTQEINKFRGQYEYGELKKGPDLNPFNYIKKEVKKNRAPDKIESGSSQSTPSNSIRPLAVSQLSRSSAVARAA